MNNSIKQALAANQPDEEVSVLEVAFQAYRDAGLRLPPVPRDLLAAFDEQPGDWNFGTAPVALTDRTDFMAAASNPATPPQVGFGHVGHGVASWWLCYRLIRPSLAVFVRQSYGSAYDPDKEGSRERVNNLVADLEQLIVSADKARAAGRLPAGQRMIVVVDDLDGSSWQVGDSAATPAEGSDAVTGALAFLGAAAV